MVKAGRVEEGCSKFEAARKLFTSTGLLLNLADCYERLNKTASAWTEFGDAALAAENAERTKDEAFAKRRQEALEPRLSRLLIRVSVPAADQVVKRDGAEIARAAWDAAIPVDPGPHTIAVEAAGRSPWSTTVTVSEPGKTVTVEVPELPKVVKPDENRSTVADASPQDNGATPAAHGPSHDETAPARGSVGTTQRVIGIVVGAGGVVTMGTSGILGLIAKSQFDAAVNEHGPSRASDSINAHQQADTASIVFAVGAVATVTGLVIWLTAPRAPIAVGWTGKGLLLSGSLQ
jgi:hypothetical protein